MTTLAPITPAQLSWKNHEPSSQQFGDIYFSPQAGSQESHYVFIQHNHLPERFSTLPNNGLYVIGETGFGTGLNLLETIACFLKFAPATARLCYISCEKHPLTPNDLQQSHLAFPQHKAMAQALQHHYPPATPGFHLLNLHTRIDLLLLFGDANELLPLCQAKIDSWFLDGFAPAKNASLWQPELYQQIARLSVKGASLATFTAAGHVRLGLQEVGFKLTKPKGFGSKREMLAGQLTGNWQPQTIKQPSVAIIGAGLAGCTTANALARAGCKVTLFDPLGVAKAASGNLAGGVYTTPSGHFNAQNRFYQSSYLRALAWFRREQWPAQAEQGALNGFIQIPTIERQIHKQQKALSSGYWPNELVSAASDFTNNSIVYHQGGYLSPPRWCEHLINHPNITYQALAVNHLDFNKQWEISTNQTQPPFYANKIVLANAHQAQRFLSQPLPIRLFKGQVTYVKATAASLKHKQAISHQGYFVPAINGLHAIGASFEPDDQHHQPEARFDQSNLALLKTWLPDIWHDVGGNNLHIAYSQVGVRCQSQHYLPLAGQVANGLYLNIAHGSRGLTATPLIADLLTSLVTETPLPVDTGIYTALKPDLNSPINRSDETLLQK